MDLYENIDIYCERTDASLWSEPVNAITNIAFFIAAYFAYQLWKTSSRKPDTLALVVLLAIIGAGSSLFHTFGNKWSMLADIIPIGIFIHVAICSIFFRVLKLRLPLAVLCTLLFGGFSFYFKDLLPHTFNSFALYTPTLIFMGCLSIGLLIAKKPLFKHFAIIAVLFAFSLAFRTIDMEVCGQFALGTHFLWHLINGAVLYTTIRAIINLQE
ncbi:MAG: ceramidase domain-containing protein [Rickettsiales bacterium]